MKTTTNNSIERASFTRFNHQNGCERVSDADSVKMRLRTGRGLSDEIFLKTALGILHDEKEPITHKVFAAQNLDRVRSAQAEEALIRIVEEKDARLSFPALNTLAKMGTEKSYEALSRIRSLPFKSLERQKDFALLMIGYKQQIPGAEKVLARLLEDTGREGRIEEFPLRFQKMEAGEIAEILNQSREAEYGITLSRSMALSLRAGVHTYYFCFTKRFDDPAGWQDALRTNQLVGQLLMKEQQAKNINRQYIAFATPMRDHVQLSIFRKNGELFMLAKVNYDREKNLFTVSNTAQENTTATARTDFPVDRRTTVTMNLSFIRHQRKKKTTELETPAITGERKE